MLESGKLNQSCWRPTTERAAFRMAWPTLKYLPVFKAVFKCPLKNYVSPKIMASLNNKNLQNISFCQVTNFSDRRNKRGSL